jgi:hypothetical protein
VIANWIEMTLSNLRGDNVTKFLFTQRRSSLDRRALQKLEVSFVFSFLFKNILMEKKTLADLHHHREETEENGRGPDEDQRAL